MTRYKRKSVFRPKRLDFSIDAKLTSKGKRYRIQVANLSKSDITVLREPTKWNAIRISSSCVLIYTKATVDTNWTEKGSMVAMLKFRDGRTLRLYRDDLTAKQWRKILPSLFHIFGRKEIGRYRN